jgi:hypothetical protein
MAFSNRKGAIIAKLGRQERRVLAHLCDEVIALFDEADSSTTTPEWARELGLDGLGEARERPTDPVLARLLPDAYTDPDQAGEFRRLTERSLRARKITNAEVVRGQLSKEPVNITDDVQSWLAFLADCRLILGTRLGVTDDDPMLPGPDPQRNLFLYLAFLQQSLVEAVMGE